MIVGVTSSIRRWLHAALASVVLVAAITAVIALLEPRVPALGLGVLYLLAVVPIALVYGFAAAGVVSVASMAAFNFFFLPPRHSLSPGTSDRWSVLVAFLVASLVVSGLAARSQREARRSARRADQQARDAGRARDVAGGAVCCGGPGGRAGVSRRERGHGPLRVRRCDDGCRDLGGFG
jgi:K+-sensing histidine kinase KdpD